MSWLHEDTKVFVNVITNKLTNADVTPIKHAAISATVRDADVTSNVLAGMINGLGARSKRFHKYADEGKFVDGLPTVSLGLNHNEPVFGLPEDPIDFPGSFYPIVSIRKDGEFLIKDTDPDRYNSTKKTLKRIALKLDDIVSSIEKTERTDENGDPVEGENPANELDDVFYVFALDLYTQHPQSVGYMYDFCELLSQHVQMNEGQFWDAIEEFESPSTGVDARGVPNNAIFFSNRDGEFEVIINFDFLSYVGNQTGLLTNPVTDKIGNYATVFPATPRELVSSGGSDEGDLTTWIDPSSVSYFKQLTRTAWGDATDSYGIWTMTGIVHETIVHAYGAEKSVFRTIGEYYNFGGQPSETYTKFHGLVVGHEDYGRSGMYFPLCKDVLEEVHTIQEEEVLVDAMMLIMHAAEEVDLEWYEQQWFRVVMVILVAVLFYIGMKDIAIKAMSLIEALTLLATKVGISFLVDLVIKEIGGELGIILGIALAYYATTKGDFSAVAGMFPQAEVLLKAVMITTDIYEAKIKTDTEELNEEVEEFKDLTRTKENAIREMYAIMGSNEADFDFLNILVEDVLVGDMRSPKQLMKDSKTTNVAKIVKSSIHEYHKRMKELPTFDHQDPSYV